MDGTPVSELQSEVRGLGSSTLDSLRDRGYERLEDLQGVERRSLTDVSGVGGATADGILLALDRRGLRTFGDPSQRSLVKLKSLLYELLRSDYAALDHGIYRLLNARRDEVESFVEEDLPSLVEDAFEAFEGVAAAEREAELERVREEIRETLGEQYLDDDGAPISPLPDVEIAQRLRREYERLADGSAATDAEVDAKATVYNDVYEFFDRYYEDGDFVPKMRLSDEHSYAVPYNGSETSFHWANREQYFVKSREMLTDYRFREGSHHVTFEIHDADVEAANRKGESKYYFLRASDPVDYDASSLTVTVHFEYRELAERDADTYGVSGGARENTRRKIQATNETRILETLPDAFADRLRAPAGEAGDTSTLERHLTRFAIESSGDFFVHRDLEGFLTRELDYYLKTEAATGADATAEEASLDGPRLEAVRAIAAPIVTFLGQVEEFQRRLFTKKKFVVDTHEFVALETVPADLVETVLDHGPQREAWAETFDVDRSLPDAASGGLDEDGEDGPEPHERFVADHPGLPVDTSLFDDRVAARLRAAVPELGDGLDGLLLKSDNYQALNLLREKYRERVRGIYIDPPYNTENDAFAYKDNYQHSTWLTMMRDRIDVARDLLQEDGLFFVSIDDHEQERLKQLLNDIFGEENFLATLVWNKNHSQQAGNFKVYHEYVHVYAKNRQAVDSSGFRATDDDPIVAGAQKVVSQKNPLGEFEFPAGTRVDTDDELVFEQGETIGNPDGEFSNVVEGRFHAKEGTLVAPVTLAAGWTQADQMRKWFDPDHEAEVLDTKGQPVEEFYFNGAGKLKYRKEKTRESVETIRDYGVQSRASDHLDGFFAGGSGYDYPKPVEMMTDVVQWLTEPGGENLFLDFFAGSGTFAEGVVEANSRDDIDRSVILVDMGEYFDDLLVPRVTKSAYAAEWDDGSPVEGTQRERGHSFRVQTLEQYDDTLDNVELERPQSSLQQFEEYVIRYMLEFEAGGKSLLDRDALENPFDYRMKVRERVAAEYREVDLPATFDYLLGLDVTRREWAEPDDRPYLAIHGTNRAGEREAVVWRSVEEIDYATDREHVTTLVDDDVETVYVNGDCAVEGARSIETVLAEAMWS